MKVRSCMRCGQPVVIRCPCNRWRQITCGSLRCRRWRKTLLQREARKLKRSKELTG